MVNCTRISGLMWVAAMLFSVGCRAGGVQEVWTYEGLEAPESAYVDERSGDLFVSLIGEGGGKVHDGDGRIVRMTTDGKMLDDAFATGLDAPKGLRSHGGTLYVTDINRIVGFDIATGEKAVEMPVAGAQLLNDLAIDAAGTIYVADTLGGKILRIRDGGVSVIAQVPDIDHPNGVVVVGDKLICANWGSPVAEDFSTQVPGRLQSIDLKNGEIKSITGPLGNLDGVESDGQGGFTVTEWMTGQLFHISPTGAATVLKQFPQGLADHAHLTDSNLLIIPEMFEGKLTAVRIK